MKIEIQELSIPVKVTILLEPDEVRKRKEKVYEQVKDTLSVIKGFRKGHIPRKEAEKRFKMEELYKKLFDELYAYAIDEKNIISSKEFKIFGDFKDTSQLKMEFVAEIEPTIEICDLNELEIVYNKNKEVNKEEIQEILDKAIIENEILEDTDRDELQNFDVAEIDFEGIIEDETKSFEGGSAKNYKITINTKSPSFVDNFEEQMIGMEIDETRDIKVKFPDNYRDKTKVGKNAVFKVKLNAIKKKVLPKLDDEFAQDRGYEDLEDYKRSVKERLFENNQIKALDDLKKSIITQLLQKSKFSPIPLDLLNTELQNEWKTFLVRMGKTEDEYLKDNPNGKDYFISNSESQTLELIKTALLLKNIAKKYNITVTREEIEQYASNISSALKYTDEKNKKILEDLKRRDVYEVQKRYTLNEKTVNFLVDYFENKNN